MTTEYINSYNINTPNGSDKIKFADDEVRNIKLKTTNTFPTINGPINKKFSDLNSLFNSIDTYSVTGNPQDSFIRMPQFIYDDRMKKKQLFIDKTGLVKYLPSLPPLGSVIKTELSLTQLDTQYGIGVFIRMDGRRLSLLSPDSPLLSFEPLYDLPNIYDSGLQQGRFLRCTKDESSTEFKKFTIVSTTSIKNLEFNNLTSDFSHSHTVSHIHAYNLPASPLTLGNTSNNGDLATGTGANTANNTWVPNTFPQATAINNTIASYSHTHTVKYNFNLENETRPRNLILNYYMRVK